MSERVAYCRPQLRRFEKLHAQNTDEVTIVQDELHQKRIDRAHRRHLSVVKSLAQVRKMGPTVQINIDERQINTSR